MQKDQNVLEVLSANLDGEDRLTSIKIIAKMLHEFGIISENNVGLLAFR